ncbi:hypothetical protein LCGC14_0311120 [marine sediment metagenome]|uniref:Uncharacterized protein n=1 Tax=marine sediment metagenome TaxID=412755 RepID=A0A0F9TSK7_9ZZZZ
MRVQIEFDGVIEVDVNASPKDDREKKDQAVHDAWIKASIHRIADAAEMIDYDEVTED